jgi:hypothetical protein
MTNNKKITVISYYSNMTGVCQAEWVDDRIAAFTNMGYSILLISSICSFRSKNNSIKHIRIPSLTPSGFKFEYEQIQLKGIKFSKSIEIIFNIYYFICKFLTGLLNLIKLRSGEGRWGWFFSSFITGIIYFRHIKSSEFIYTTGGPPSADISGILLAKIFCKKNISELQDPLTGKDIGRNKISKFAFNHIEKFIICFSTITFYCTKNAMLVAKKKYANMENKIDYVYPGSNKINNLLNVTNEGNKHKINITYLGSLYQTRNLDFIMKAINELAIEDSSILEKIHINLYGNIDADIKNRIIDFCKLYKIITIHGLISREQAILKAHEADVLLLIQNTDDRSILTIPFKTYDYLNVGNHIFGLVYKNDELQNMLNSNGHSSCQADDTIAIKNILLEILISLNNLKNGIKESQYTPEFAAIKMLQILNLN